MARVTIVVEDRRDGYAHISVDFHPRPPKSEKEMTGAHKLASIALQAMQEAPGVNPAEEGEGCDA